jgi:hypothetical protein
MVIILRDFGPCEVTYLWLSLCVFTTLDFSAILEGQRSSINHNLYYYGNQATENEMNGIYTLRGTWKFIHFEKTIK